MGWVGGGVGGGMRGERERCRAGERVILIVFQHPVAPPRTLGPATAARRLATAARRPASTPPPTRKPSARTAWRPAAPAARGGHEVAIEGSMNCSLSSRNLEPACRRVPSAIDVRFQPCSLRRQPIIASRAVAAEVAHHEQRVVLRVEEQVQALHDDVLRDGLPRAPVPGVVAELDQLDHQLLGEPVEEHLGALVGAEVDDLPQLQLLEEREVELGRRAGTVQVALDHAEILAEG